MHISTTKSQLASQLSLVIGAADQRASVPMLATILMKTTEDKRLSLLCSDNGVVARAITPCASVAEGGEFAVDARRFNELVRAIPDDAAIDLSLEAAKKAGDGKNLLLKAGRSRFRLPVFGAEDYPKMVPEKTERLSITLAGKRLAELIEQTAPAIGVNDVRPYLNGALFQLDSTGLTVVSTDGFRLIIAHESVPNMPAVDKRVIVPRKSLLLAKKLLSLAGDSPVKLTVGNADVQFSFSDGSVIFTKTIPGSFPDFKKVMPSPTTTAELATSTTKSILAMVSASIMDGADKTNKFRIDLDLSDKLMVIRQGDNSRSEVDCTLVDGKATTVSVNINYLRDALDSCGAAKTIRIGCSSERSPMLVRPTEADYPINIVMPMTA